MSCVMVFSIGNVVRQASRDDSPVDARRHNMAARPLKYGNYQIRLIGRKAAEHERHVSGRGFSLGGMGMGHWAGSRWRNIPHRTQESGTMLCEQETVDMTLSPGVLRCLLDGVWRGQILVRDNGARDRH